MSMIWAAPSMWIERVPVLLANKLELWSKFGLSFNKVQLKVCNGGQETLDIKQNKFDIGEIGLFPFVVYIFKLRTWPGLNVHIIFTLWVTLY